MKNRPQWEIPIGNMRTLDWLAEPVSTTPHPLQEIIEEFVETQLDDYDRELFWMRYGEQLPIRTIAERLGYNSHRVVQIQLERIEEKCEEWLNERTAS